MKHDLMTFLINSAETKQPGTITALLSAS